MAKPLVSVIVPTADHPLELAELLWSLSAQTFTDFEVVVYNYGRTSVEAIARRIDGLQPRLFASTAVSLTGALNEAVSAAQGKYLVVLMDRDILVPSHLSSLMARSKGVDLLHTDGEVVVWERQGTRRVCVERKTFAFDGDLRLLRKWNTVPGSGTLYRRELYDSLGGFDETAGAYWDWDFALRAAVTHRIGRLPLASVLFGVDAEEERQRIPNSQEDAQREVFVKKHQLGDFIPLCLMEMTKDPILRAHQRPTRILWDGQLEVHEEAGHGVE